MKKIFCALSIMLLTLAAFCQQRPGEEYRIKSRHLRAGGFMLVAAGGGLATAGIILISTDNNNINYNNNTLSSRSTTGVLLIAAGIVSEIGSIPLFVVSRAMHKKAGRAMRASTFLDIEKIPVSISGVPLQPFPALGIKLNF